VDAVEIALKLNQTEVLRFMRARAEEGWKSRVKLLTLVLFWRLWA
jgi:hypothetical protein